SPWLRQMGWPPHMPLPVHLAAISEVRRGHVLARIEHVSFAVALARRLDQPCWLLNAEARGGKAGIERLPLLDLRPIPTKAHGVDQRSSVLRNSIDDALLLGIISTMHQVGGDDNARS